MTASAERVPEMVELAKLTHTCGGMTWVIPKKRVRKSEIKALRKIMSYFYDGARVMLTSEDQPNADFNEASKKYMLSSAFLKKEQKLDTLNGEALDKKVKEIHDMMPSDWHVHLGPKVADVQKLLLAPIFRRKLGTKSIELFNKSASGKSKVRNDFFLLLVEKYELEQQGNIKSDETCKIGADLDN